MTLNADRKASGVRVAGVATVRSRFIGALRDDPRSRQEFLALTGTTR
ncbi:MAG: GTP cyclohydrolase I type 1 [uncultured Propionibacteriaceae bacterium]|uniref:GTP cyclohydrolase I type 1 n=1 Tax=uncultured Propionibacteriaceae bacterium TaxID=257457 RepID=A0A6J4PI12_9ACTN|nr:MAG: GTP cyclohydrolase I type 1 [uncultured Propionibacteriaceae bacterium]